MAEELVKRVARVSKEDSVVVVQLATADAAEHASIVDEGESIPDEMAAKGRLS